MKRAPGIPAASKRPCSSGTRASPRECVTSVGACTRDRLCVTSISPQDSRMRAATSGRVVRRMSSSNQVNCSLLPPGMKSSVNNRRKAGVSAPQPTRTTSASAFPARVVFRIAPGPALRVSTVDHQVTDMLRVTHGVFDRDGRHPATARAVRSAPARSLRRHIRDRAHCVPTTDRPAPNQTVRSHGRRSESGCGLPTAWKTSAAIPGSANRTRDG